MASSEAAAQRTKMLVMVSWTLLSRSCNSSPSLSSAESTRPSSTSPATPRSTPRPPGTHARTHPGLRAAPPASCRANATALCSASGADIPVANSLARPDRPLPRVASTVRSINPLFDDPISAGHTCGEEAEADPNLKGSEVASWLLCVETSYSEVASLSQRDMEAQSC